MLDESYRNRNLIRLILFPNFCLPFFLYFLQLFINQNTLVINNLNIKIWKMWENNETKNDKKIQKSQHWSTRVKGVLTLVRTLPNAVQPLSQTRSTRSTRWWRHRWRHRVGKRVRVGFGSGCTCHACGLRMDRTPGRPRSGRAVRVKTRGPWPSLNGQNDAVWTPYLNPFSAFFFLFFSRFFSL